MTAGLTAAETLLRSSAHQERQRQLQKAAADSEKFQQEARSASVAKMARLRELRLAHEATQREAAALRKAEKAAKPKRPRKPKVAATAPDDIVVEG